MLVKRVIVSNVRIFEAISPQSALAEAGLTDNQSGLTKLQSPETLYLSGTLHFLSILKYKYKRVKNNL